MKNQLVELHYNCLSFISISFFVTICQNQCQRPEDICQNNGNACSTFSVHEICAAVTIIKNQWIQRQWISIVNYYSQEVELSTYYLDSKKACDSELSNKKEHLDPVYRS